ncbi:extracellular catalytic domain type 1 short-chain-length polyhydroxyalkanoate depolymerase [Shewanella waksmanii]|uniref:extracellular catalytic domain type 1 short-chain-length polyhydroxyalkanoate depolymerase n=1 Tax=Shewanella waksmanii TaxID=213783 RepID=UPI0004AC70FC|nr:PHB depolymerase family esterase [Shewanella waksmanii]
MTLFTLSRRIQWRDLLLLISFIAPFSYAGSWQQNVSIGGFNQVHIYTPDSHSSIGQGKALMLVLHGCVQPINNYLTANLEQAAEAHGMVIAVPDAMNKAGYSCWSYWQGSISRTAGDYKNLINLANTLVADSSRNIDADQVYIAGLSSGAAMAAQTACVAPDVFAGVAPSAGPTIGTSSNGAISVCESVAPSTFKSRCESYAGSFQAHLATQVAVVGHGDADTTVNTCYNQQNANGYAAVYGVAALSGTTTISDGVGHTATESLWSDGRVAMLWLQDLDHSWSGGAGASGDYVADDSINFADYLGQFFAANNQRVNRNAGPELSQLSATAQNQQISVSGIALDAEGSVSHVSISIYAIGSGAQQPVETLSVSVDSSNQFSALSSALTDGLYEVELVATDNEGQLGDSVKVSVRIGPEPAPSAPLLSQLEATVAGQCVTLSGVVSDINLNVSNVTVSIDSGSALVANISGTGATQTFSREVCQLSGGAHNAEVQALDDSGLSTSETIGFNIDAGVSGDYNLHISEGHITWGVGYSGCYLAFGSNSFTMREYPSGNDQCQWVADGDSSCAGPLQACSAGQPVTDSDGDGINDDIDNCVDIANSDQADNDADGIGNLCDSTPDGGLVDSDNDGIADVNDNCPAIANSDQADNDADGIGNVCDSTPDGDSFSCTDTTASNYAHVLAGRATTNGIYAFALGSNANMGLYNIFYSTTLAQTADGYYQIGTCP